MLTIAIPTYNRNALVRKNVTRLITMIGPECRILVVDNASTVPVTETLHDLLEAGERSIKVIRNVVNVGANANILKCVEYCETPYIWIVGDDDFLAPRAIPLATEILSKRPLWVNFKSSDIHQPTREKPAECGSLIEFLSSLKSINELVFISNNIYLTECIRAGLYMGCQYQSTMAPHVLAMIDGARRKETVGRYLISTEEVFETISGNVDESTAWPLYQAFIGIIPLHQVPFQRDIRDQLLRLTRGARAQWLSNRHMFSGIASLAKLVGKRDAFLTVPGLLASLVVVDRIGILVSWPVVIFSILFGEPIKRILKR